MYDSFYIDCVLCGGVCVCFVIYYFLWVIWLEICEFDWVWWCFFARCSTRWFFRARRRVGSVIWCVWCIVGIFCFCYDWLRICDLVWWVRCCLLCLLIVLCVCDRVRDRRGTLSCDSGCIRCFGLFWLWCECLCVVY